MGLYNTHGMSPDDEEIEEAFDILAFHGEELEALVQNAHREVYVWEKMAEHGKGQKKRKYNLFAKHWRLRRDKWIELMVQYEMEYSEHIDEFPTTQPD